MEWNSKDIEKRQKQGDIEKREWDRKKKNHNGRERYIELYRDI